MTDISFYHLQSEPIERALPRLLEKVIERGFRVLVRGLTEERLDALDESFWNYRPDSFLPHARDAEGVVPAEQPILLTLSEDAGANDANVLVLTEDAPAADLAPFERCLYMFDGNDDVALAAARTRWKEFKDSDISVSYYQQTDTGWRKKA